MVVNENILPFLQAVLLLHPVQHSYQQEQQFCCSNAPSPGFGGCLEPAELWFVVGSWSVVPEQTVVQLL